MSLYLSISLATALVLALVFTLFAMSMFVSLYLPDSSVTDALNIFDVCLRTVSCLRAFWETLHGSLKLVVATDSNVEVRSHLSDAYGTALTGPGLLGADVCCGDGGKARERRRMYTQLRMKVEDWMMEERLVASNTFRERER